MMWRAFVAAAVAGSIALVPASASAKGVSEITISGPGLKSPIRLTNPGTERPDSPANELAAATGFTMAFSPSVPNSLQTNPPSGRLGPRYVATYVLSSPGTKRVAVHQDLYPLADGGAVTYTPPGQRYLRVKSRGGWYPYSGPLLTDWLVTAGVSLPAAARTTVTAAVCFQDLAARPPASQYIGLPILGAQAVARHEARIVQVIGADGFCGVTTLDLVPSRVDVYLVHGAITQATTG